MAKKKIKVTSTANIEGVDVIKTEDISITSPIGTIFHRMNRVDKIMLSSQGRPFVVYTRVE